MQAVELCAGAGGLSCGLAASGIDVIAAVEWNEYCAATYRANFPHTSVIERDLAVVQGGDLLRRIGLRKGQLDALVAGLPCQGFSESNRRTRVATNPKNQLYQHVLKLLEELEPRWFLLENVAGLTTLESGRFLGRMLDDFRERGYEVQWATLNAKAFGVPQHRRRTFVVGNGDNKDFSFPEGDTGEGVTVRDAIEDLPALQNGAGVDTLNYGKEWVAAGTYAQSRREPTVDAVSGNQVSRNTKRVLERYEHIGPGQNWQAIPRRLMRNYANLSGCHTGIYYRLEWDTESKVIGNFRKNMLIHPSQNRGLSVREAARLQSFPDAHVFVGPLNDRQQQVGDAVPPRLAEAVGAALLQSDGS